MSDIEKLKHKITKKLALLVLKRYKPGIIGIAGEVGKSSAKEAIRRVLDVERRVQVSPENTKGEEAILWGILGNNSKERPRSWLKEIALPSIGKLLWKQKTYPELLVLEYEVEKPGDMKRLLDIVRPQIAVVTAMGETPMYAENFPTKEGVMREMLKMIRELPASGLGVVNLDEGGTLMGSGGVRARFMTYGTSQVADVKIQSIESKIENKIPITRCKIAHGGSVVPIRLQGTIGRAQAYAAAASATIGLIFGMNLVKVAEALTLYEVLPGRLKVIPGIKGSVIIDDTYNASPLSVDEALRSVKALRVERKIGVFGDLLALGKKTVETHEKIGRYAGKIFDLLVTVGTRANFIAEKAKKSGLAIKNIIQTDSVKEAKEKLTSLMQEGDVVFVTGSEGMRMERIVEEIMENPISAKELLVRQSVEWQNIPGAYEKDFVPENEVDRVVES